MKKIAKYVILDILRNRIMIAYTVLLLLISFSVFSLEDNVEKSVLSLINLVLLIVPLVSIIFSTIYVYNSSEFIELLVAQPTLAIQTRHFKGSLPLSAVTYVRRTKPGLHEIALVDGTIIEGTSGNTGMGLALAAVVHLGHLRNDLVVNLISIILFNNFPFDEFKYAGNRFQDL